MWMFRFAHVAKVQEFAESALMSGDMSGHMGLLPVKFECLDCGWRERLVVKATNRKLSLKQVAIIAEALNFKKE